ncbi:MAG: AAA family ATPase, partial [Bacteroidota bacterium]
MAIIIKIKCNSDDSSEAKALGQLKDKLEIELSGISKYAHGEILIVSNVTLFGQETKDIDIVMIGKLQNFKFQITSNAKDRNASELPIANREAYLNSFCYVIEVKDHSHTGVKQDGLNLLVKYNAKWSDATSQSEKQKYALINYLNEHLGFSPNICNFIWLKNISTNELAQLNQNHKDNILPASFTLKDIVTKSTFQFIPYKPDNQEYCIINCVNQYNEKSFDLSELQRVFTLFSEIRKAVGELTRKKIEQMTSATLDKQQYAQNIGTKLTIIAGRAGTGKTVRLLRIACDLAVNKGSRSLILTYNHALVSDIRRVLALAGIPDGVDSYTVQISTLHKFFFQIFSGLGLGGSAADKDKNYNDLFKDKMTELLDFLNENLIDEKDIQELMRKEHETVGWDYILIDEAQDWNDVEKQVLFKLFGPEKIVVADG